MRYLFHGTTIEACNEILTGNYNPEKTVWNCSDDYYMYVWELNKLCEAEGYEDDSLELVIDHCVERANESAQIANAILPNPYNQTVVIQFSIPDYLFKHLMDEGYLDYDDSCENMYDSGAMMLRSAVINDLIKAHEEIGIKVYYLPFYPKLSLFYLVGLFDNQYFQETLEKLPSEDYRALEMLTKVDFCAIWEDIIYAESENEHTICKPKFDDNGKEVN